MSGPRIGVAGIGRSNMNGSLIRRMGLMLLLGAGMSSVAWGQSATYRSGDINNSVRDSGARQEWRTGSARLVQTDWHWWDRDGDHHSDRWYREHGYYNNGNGWYRPDYRTNNGWYNPYYGNNNGWYNGYHGDGDHDRDDRWRRNDHDRDDRWRRNDHDRDDRWRHNDHDRDDRHRHHDHDRD